MRMLLAASALLARLALAGSAGAQSPTLFGTVGPGFTIKLADASGNTVQNLDPGTYTIQIEDKSDIHNFHLTGPGVNRTTSKLGKATLVWKVTLKRGLYTYRSDATPTLRGTFRVTV